MKKKILLLGTGGTIACRRTDAGLTPALTSDDLLACVPAAAEFCDVEAVQICNVDSTSMTPDIWTLITRTIEENYSRYDGFVVCHGTDTLAYTAAALSYMIQNSRKPVVITGSQRPIDAEDTDARGNLLDSLLYASTYPSQGVSIVFGGRVIAGTRAKKERAKSYNAFTSINFPDLAVIRSGRIYRYIEPKLFDSDVRFYEDMSAGVCVLKLIPGLSDGILTELFRRNDCVILESFGVGGIPEYLMSEFTEIMKTMPDKLAIIATQVIEEGSDMNVYKVGKLVKREFDLLETYDMTIEAAVTKAKWILGQHLPSRESVKAEFYRSINYDLLT